MDVLEKVMNTLERCESYGQCDDDSCPYYREVACLESLRKDAMELLKTQEPLKPVLKKIRLGFHTDAVRIEPCCGGCGHKLDLLYRYCPYCGRAVKLDD